MAVPTSGAVNATEFGDACPSPSTVNYSVGEDCLNLNIWRPSGANEDNPLPVIVWIHGGGFILDSAVNPFYDGSKTSGNEDIMFVSIDYRLGIFGYLPQDINGTGGMNGILDQVEALKWVQQYISYFGGDPNQVTIFGQSAGAHSVGILNVLPKANGLFQRSIMDSGIA
ncbi:alpha/beta-hydrolase, partial [Fragilariopsis cylindrus CCMP1102]